MAGSRKWMERPKSPRRTLPMKTAYCTGRGRSRPSSRRTRSISLVGASGGSRSGTGSPLSRITTKTTVVTSHTATSARSSLETRNARMPIISVDAARGPDGGAPGGEVLRALELEVERPDLELLVRVRRELHVLLQPVILVGLDDRQPHEVLQKDLRHFLVGLATELLVHREARRVAELVEAWLAPV